MDNQRNLLLAVALSGLLIIGWDFAMRTFYPEAAITAPTEQIEPAAQTSAAGAPGTSTVAADLPDGAEMPAGPVDLSAALADPNRVVIDTPKLAGSINLVGAQIDDIVLKDYRQTVDKDSGPVRLFAPARTEDQYFAQFGFVVGGERMPSNAVWEANGASLTPSTPVTLTRTDEAGLTYSIALSIDEEYMISATQSVANASEAAAIIQPFTLIDRTSKNASPDEFIVHSGPIGVFGDTLHDPNNYEELAEIGRDIPEGTTDWLGFTDRYWLSALIPGEGETASSGFRALGGEMFRSGITYEAQTIPTGGSLTQSTRLFAGAKDSIILDEYEESGITYFGKAISWGWFEFIEKPFLWLLRTLNGLVGNFGVAIILLTVIIRGLMFPIAQKQFSSMAGMKALQPKMKALQERYKDDKPQQQQEIMKLYKEEGVNPLAGCLPILIQIPIFFALYKVLMLAIEMRHEPFLYIRDLSGPDPATILNLFGYLPYDVPGFLGIGVLAVLLGVTMWLTFKLNPSAMDPMQQQIFNLMPWILMFVMAPFAAGLLIYWVTSNILTVAQQSYLYSKHPALKAQAKKDKEEMARKKAEADKAKSKGEA
ncbi:membrane protein insertase YidC [Erythrobacter insulae]|uniref:Membrane protein insertase YidC n=1 Tax=Erythrobacter insulae TaxID=2584124 RepID=A0A547PC37_9SPHN|nr:membrane protein insertase YidC [Erythrobacter insulae]TRD11706.1 membrane protein insertase YidC [Erythrobacter insulae]